MRLLVLATLIVVAAATQNYYRLPSPYSYGCQKGLCVKEERTHAREQRSLGDCQLTCGEYGALWPQPTGEVQLAQDVVHFDPYNMQVTKIASSNQKVADMLDEATRYMKRNIHFMHPNFPQSQKTPYCEDVQALFEEEDQNSGRFNQRQQQQRQQQQQQQQYSFRTNQQQGQNEFTSSEQQTFEQWERYSPFRNQRYNAAIERQNVNIEITVTSPEEKFSIENTDESYNLVVQTVDDETTVTILATSYYGARHALESLTQLIAYDDENESLMIVSSAKIQDQPQYKYRGVMLDTGRNFYTKEELMTLLDSMSQNKMNVFHWHITDAASFPLYSNRQPQMAYYGAYSPRKVYYPEDIREIVRYARLRGVMVIPELNGPAHSTAGWQWGEKEGRGSLSLCTNKESPDTPWFTFSKEPFSGQLNPVNPEVYSVLGEVYSDMLDYFDPEMFHMGGDGVSFKCWQNAPEIKEYLAANKREASSREYFELWNTFQSNAYSKLQEAAKGRKVTPIIHSSSFARNYIAKDTYYIQLSENADSNDIADYVNNGFKVIFSNPDQWRLDCAGETWVGEKAASCPVEIPTWRNFYNNSPLQTLYNLGITNARADLPANRPTYSKPQQQSRTEVSPSVNPKEYILGGTATLWSSETDGNSYQAKLWPRVSALAERLWSDPIQNTNAFDTTQKRLNIQRQRMVTFGIKADPAQPEYCSQDESACYDREQYQLRAANVPV